MIKSMVLCVPLLVSVFLSGCAPQPTETPTPVPPTATPALDTDTLYDLLIKAIQDSDKTEVARLITAGAPIARVNDLGVTPLMIAAFKDDAEAIGLLLDAGADPEVLSPAGLNALILAAQQGKANAIRALVEGGALVDAADNIPNHHTTALHWAISLLQTEAVRALIDVGADLNIVPEGRTDTPLIRAVKANFVEAVGMLVEAGADPAIRAKGKTPLDYAKELGNEEIIALLEAADAP